MDLFRKGHYLVFGKLLEGLTEHFVLLIQAIGAAMTALMEQLSNFSDVFRLKDSSTSLVTSGFQIVSRR